MNKPQASDLKRGEHRCPGPSTRDIIEADGERVPDALLAQSYKYLGDEDIGYERYTSRAFYEREMALMWPRVWQWACRVEHIPEAGDYFVYDVGKYSILIVRTETNDVKAYINSCTHRGTQLRPSGSSGSADRFRCPFHGWTFDLSGKLVDVPCQWDFPHLDQKHNLDEIRCEIWGGFVFINMDKNAGPLADYLAPLPAHFKDGWDLGRRVIHLHIQKELPCNWKLAQEAFLESYHVVETHSDFLPIVADANAQYDVFGKHVSRFINPQGVSSPHYKTPITQQEILDRMLISPGRTVVPEGRTARAVAAEELRKVLSTAWGTDLSGYTTSEMLDSIEYHIFPSAFFFPGVSLSLIYRFRPYDDDHTRALFDLILLRPLAENESLPEPPEPVRIGIDDSYTTVPGLPATLGRVYDQDTGNLKMQWRGIQASSKKGETLGDYQEVLIRHMHQTLDQYLSASPADKP